MRESLKCRGFSESFLRAWNWANLACEKISVRDSKQARRTSMTGSHGPVGGGGMPQSTRPDICGGLSRSRICDSSSSTAGGGGGAPLDEATGTSISSDTCARVLWLLRGGRFIMTCVLRAIQSRESKQRQR